MIGGRVVRLGVVCLLILPSLAVAKTPTMVRPLPSSAANSPSAVRADPALPQSCGFGLGKGAVMLPWPGPMGINVSALAQRFSSVALAKRWIGRNAARANSCREASMLPLPAQFARIGEQRFIVRVGAGGLMFVRHGRSVAIVSEFNPFSLAKLGRLAMAAARRIAP
jgi:hypothetical protein